MVFHISLTMWHFRRRLWIVFAALVLGLLAGLAVLSFCNPLAEQADPEYASLLDRTKEPAALDEATVARIKAFCGDCHAVPRPDSFHADRWHEEVRKGFEFYIRSGRKDLDPPTRAQTIAYFRSLAPAQLSYPVSPEAPSAFPVSFQTETLENEKIGGALPAVAGLCWTRLRPDASPVLLVSDMLSGDIAALDFRQPRRLRCLAHLDNPCHMEPSDLDADGTLDLLVADLGSCSAEDHGRGRVVWLRQDPQTGEFEEVVLAAGLGRVADARPIDSCVPDRPDVVVAEFGRYRTGNILLLKNTAPRGQRPRFEPEILDSRTGSIHVPVCDLNGDGRPDFIALLSNEHECIEAFLNQGNGTFHRHALWRAPDLTYGSTGIQLVDLNGDGKLDILYSNGDSFDNQYLSPWHGVQWLENLGGGRFQFHRLTEMPGAHVALAGDFDGNGLLDIVVVSCLAPNLGPATVDTRSLASVVLLEQASPGRFLRHTLERGCPWHAALAVGDFDSDGRLDFVVGHNMLGGLQPQVERQTWGTLWRNRGKGPDK
jgi:hypothetical protein